MKKEVRSSVRAVRFEPSLVEDIQNMADQEQRTFSNMVRVMAKTYINSKAKK